MITNPNRSDRVVDFPSLYLVSVQHIFAGARVYLACRSVVKGEAASAQIEARTGLPAATRAPVMKLDLSSLTSVRNFVSEFKQREYSTF